MSKTELLWKDYEMSIDLLKSYLDMIIKLNMFYYAITGGILSFHFSGSSNDISIYAFILPIILSIGLSALFFYGALLAQNLREGIKKRASLLGLEMYPEGVVLVLLCCVFGVASFTVATALLYYYLIAS